MIKPTEIIAGAIAIYEDVFSNDMVNQIVSDFENLAKNPKENVFFERAKINVPVTQEKTYSDIRTNSYILLTQHINDDERVLNLNNVFNELLQQVIPGYIDIFDISEKLYVNESINLLRYQTGQEFKSHYDGSTISKRAVSPILYINDDYTGGEIEFTNFNIKIKPKAGTLMVFPANYAYTHIAHPVKTGTKYALVTWLHDRE
jgi:hypothetical protein